MYFRITSIFVTIAMFFVMIQATPYSEAYLNKFRRENLKNGTNAVLLTNGTNHTEIGRGGTNTTTLVGVEANATTEPNSSLRIMVSLGSLVFAVLAFIASLSF
ncbi:hypothetical protein PMAC_000296 [Pneumocystis sp. 'macacae']|nr:hypothetical protein PMAC_000296 [Pneumocystis sp. 'macacae']